MLLVLLYLKEGQRTKNPPDIPIINSHTESCRVDVESSK